jgi:DDE family transposase
VTKKKPKPYYRTRNWKDYNKALVGRGSLTIWFDTQSQDQWLNHSKTDRRGRPNKYADAAIVCCLTLREVFHLPLRQTQGLVCSILRLLNIDLSAPHYSILSRRGGRLNVKLGSHPEKIKHLVFDASGLKVFGEGEWKVRLHKAEKRRTWRKLHISIDADTQQVITAVVTGKGVVDPRMMPRQLKQVEARVENVYGDGAFDSRDCYRAIHQKGAKAIIPPREGSTTWKDEYLADRNSNVGGVEELGDKEWKKQVGYHKRSLVETAFFRLKTIFSDKLRGRGEDRQTTEAMIRCAALNRMTSLGMPDSHKVA